MCCLRCERFADIMLCRCIFEAGLREVFDIGAQVGETVAAVWREVFGDADVAEEVRFEGDDVVGFLVAIEVTKDSGDSFGDHGVGVHAVVAALVFKLWYEPKARHAAGNQSVIGFCILFERWEFASHRQQVGQAFVAIRQDFKSADQGFAFIFDCHGSGEF